MTSQSDSFGKKLVAYRRRLGMTQRTLAERVGLTPSHLSRIEHDSRKPPNAEVVGEMVRVLRLDRGDAEDLVKLAGYSLHIMNSSTVPRYGGVFATPLELRDQTDNPHTSFAEQVARVLAEADLPYEELLLAQRMILAQARTICRVLQDEVSERDSNEQSGQ